MTSSPSLCETSTSSSTCCELGMCSMLKLAALAAAQEAGQPGYRCMAVVQVVHTLQEYGECDIRQPQQHMCRIGTSDKQCSGAGMHHSLVALLFAAGDRVWVCASTHSHDQQCGFEGGLLLVFKINSGVKRLQR